jgi:hypothetical protein
MAHVQPLSSQGMGRNNRKITVLTSEDDENGRFMFDVSSKATQQSHQEESEDSDCDSVNAVLGAEDFHEIDSNALGSLPTIDSRKHKDCLSLARPASPISSSVVNKDDEHAKRSDSRLPSLSLSSSQSPSSSMLFPSPDPNSKHKSNQSTYLSTSNIASLRIDTSIDRNEESLRATGIPIFSPTAPSAPPQRRPSNRGSPAFLRSPSNQSIGSDCSSTQPSPVAPDSPAFANKAFARKSWRQLTTD